MATQHPGHTGHTQQPSSSFQLHIKPDIPAQKEQLNNQKVKQKGTKNIKRTKKSTCTRINTDTDREKHSCTYACTHTCGDPCCPFPGSRGLVSLPG